MAEGITADMLVVRLMQHIPAPQKSLEPGHAGTA
jgi:hypothetical protein